MTLFRISLIFLGLLCLGTLLGQSDETPTTTDSTLTLEMQVRPRTEWRDGYRLVQGDEALGNLYTTQRTRLGLMGQIGAFSAKAGFQDVREWHDGGLQGQIMLYESWVRWQRTEQTTITAGRQRISLDNQRIIGGLDWSQYGRFFDGISAMHVGSLGTTLAALTTDIHAGLHRGIFHHSWSSERYQWSGLAFQQWAPNHLNARVFTGGGTLKRTGSEGWDWELEGYVQKYEGSSVWAWYWTGGVLKHWTSENQTRIALDNLSGSIHGAAFAPFLGTNHKHYGWIDHFYVGTMSDGLWDAQWQQDGRIGLANWTLRFHHFRTPDGEHLLANELDAGLTFQPDPHVIFQLGGAIMAAAETQYERQLQIPPSENRWQTWAWVSLSVAPSIEFRSQH